MKTTFTLLSFLVALSLHAQDKDEQAIRSLLDKQTIEWNRGNINGFMQGYWKSDSLSFVGKNGVRYGYSNTLENYKKGYPDTVAMGKLYFDILRIQRLSPVYFSVLGKWTLRRTIGDLTGYYTLLLRKINNEWVIVSDHSS